MEELRNNTIEELRHMALEKRNEKALVAQELLRGKESDVSKLRKLKKEIAQIQTVISEKSNEVKNA